ncbi:MAG: (Na+)-NQR maturation NqrM [Pseudomonadota bacterium]
MVFILAFVIMAIIMAGMAIGVMSGREPLKGSCGGLAAVGIEGKCEICGDDPSRCEEQSAKAAISSDESFYDEAKYDGTKHDGTNFDGTR